MENVILARKQEAEQSGNYAEARRVNYDPLADQVGAITKALAHLRASGIDIGPDGDSQVDRVQAVKDLFPKPQPN